MADQSPKWVPADVDITKPSAARAYDAFLGGGHNFEVDRQFAERAEQVCARARVALEHGDVVLVGHGHFGRALIASWLQLPVTAGVRFALEPAGVAVLGHERGTGQLRQLLPAPLAG